MKRTHVIAGMTRNPLIVFCLFAALFCAACSDPSKAPEIGTIMFTSNFDCEIRLFASNNGDQLIREFYEVGKEPVIVQMKYSGVYVLHAESSGKKTKKEPLAYNGGNLEHYIEF